MNSTELKRALLADPTHLQPEQLQQLEQDADLRAALSEALELNGLIHQAMKVSMPEELEEKLQSISCASSEPTQSDAWHGNLFKGLALAASVTLAVFAWNRLVPGDLSADVIAHIQHEPASLMSDNAVDPRDAQSLLSDYGLELKGTLGKITYLTRCRVQGHAGIHMVLDTDRGRVTVLLVPGLKVKSMTEIHGDGLEGYAIGLRKQFAMAIVGQAGQPLMQVERMLRSAIQFKSSA